MGAGEKVPIPMIKMGGVLSQRSVSDEEADAVISSLLCTGCLTAPCKENEVTMRPPHSSLENFRVLDTETPHLPVFSTNSVPVAASSRSHDNVSPGGPTESPKKLPRAFTTGRLGPTPLFLPPSMPQHVSSLTPKQDPETPTSSVWASPKQAEMRELHNAIQGDLKQVATESDWMSRTFSFSLHGDKKEMNTTRDELVDFASRCPHRKPQLTMMNTGFSMASRETLASTHSQFVVTCMSDLMHSPSQPNMDPQDTTAMLSWRRSCLAYFALCFGITNLSAAAAVILWSEMGCAPVCLEAMQDAQGKGYARILASLLVAILTLLYLLDFFCPPHMPGQHFVLRVYGYTFGHSLAVLLVCMTLAVFFLVLNDIPTVPLALTVFLAPVSVIVLRYATLPERPSRPLQDTEEFEVRLAIDMLRELSVEEWDQKNFYSGASVAFLLTSLACISVWIPWAEWDEARFSEKMSGTDGIERQAMLIAWAVPLFVFGSNLAFASFAGLRVALNRSYSATDELRTKLIGRGSRSKLGERMMRYQIARLLKEMDQLSLNHDPTSLVDTAKDRRQQFLVQRTLRARQLSNIVKSIGCAFVVMLGGVYVTFQITVTESEIAQAIQGFLFLLFLTFLVFFYVSFNRVWRTMSDWVMDLPLWKSIVSMSRSEFACAMAVFFFGPLVPFVLALSAVNQRIRRCRKLDDETLGATSSSKEPLSPSRILSPAVAIPEEAAGAMHWQPSVSGEVIADTAPIEEEGGWAAQGLFTARVYGIIEYASSWDWLSVLHWCYVVGAMVIVYQVTPLALNILLAWLRSVLHSLNFGLIVVATFVVGLLLFMLPPVPGPPIYLFGGLVISDTCPWGFWWGTAMCIVLCFVMKLCACAVQQKLIGEKIGNSEAVRRTCGLHKPFMRAVKNVLARPGLSFGKCMILCGGPDWPTSVLAGIMRLSLGQCLIGTCPIILSLVPLVLTGSFLMKGLAVTEGEEEIWERMGSFMFSLTLLISVMFWAGMGWAIQDEFDRHHAELNRPRAEDLELDWADYCAAHIAARSAVKWRDMPKLMRWLLCAGSLGMIATGHLHMWMKSGMYGQFGVDSEVGDLEIEDVVKPLGAIGLACACTSYVFLFVFKAWLRHRNRSRVSRAWTSLKQEEKFWKERRLAEAQQALENAAVVAAHTAARNLEHADDGFFSPVSEGGESCIRSSAIASSIPASPVASLRSLRDSAGDGAKQDSPMVCVAAMAATVFGMASHPAAVDNLDGTPSIQNSWD